MCVCVCAGISSEATDLFKHSQIIAVIVVSKIDDTATVVDGMVVPYPAQPRVSLQHASRFPLVVFVIVGSHHIQVHAAHLASSEQLCDQIGSGVRVFYYYPDKLWDVHDGQTDGRQV